MSILRDSISKVLAEAAGKGYQPLVFASNRAMDRIGDKNLFEFNARPLLQRVMIYNGVGGEDNERFFQGPITAQWRMLHSAKYLLAPHALKDARGDFEARKEDYRSPEEFTSLLRAFSQDVSAIIGYAAAKRGAALISEHTHKAGEVNLRLHKEFALMYITDFTDLDKKFDRIMETYQYFNGVLRKGHEDLFKFSRALNKGLKRLAKGNPLPQEEYIRETMHALGWYTSLCDFDIRSEQMNTKLCRVQALRKIDEDLGLAYFSHTPFTTIGLYALAKKERLEMHVEMDPRCQCVDDFWKFDDLVYIDTLKLLELPKQSVKGNGLEKKVEEPKEEKPVIALTAEEESIDYVISSITDNIANGNFTDDMGARIQFFSYDVHRIGLDEGQIEDICESFDRLKLDKKMKNRNTRLNEKRFRNFFDDVTSSVMKGDLPDTDELDILYENA